MTAQEAVECVRLEVPPMPPHSLPSASLFERVVPALRPQRTAPQVNPEAACERLTREAYARWEREGAGPGDTIVDDVTAIVVFFGVEEEEEEEEEEEVSTARVLRYLGTIAYPVWLARWNPVGGGWRRARGGRGLRIGCTYRLKIR